MGHPSRRLIAAAMTLMLVQPLLAGCLVVERGGMSEEDEAGLKVYREYEADPAAATARFLEAWRTGAPRRSQDKARSRWIAIAGLLSSRGQGPTNEFRMFLIESLDDTNPAIAVQAARELTLVAGKDVVNALLDKTASTAADATVREASAMALIEKVEMRMFSSSEGDEAVLLDRLTAACVAPQRTTQLVALCEQAKQALSRRAEERKLDACVGRPIASPADCIRDATK